MSDDSQCIGHEPCPKCGSKDNLGRYDDGHGFCFGCKYYEPGEGGPASSPKTTKGNRVSNQLLTGEYEALTKRGIKEETCRLFGYQIGFHNEKQVHLANYKDPAGTSVVAQKVRDREKNFHVRGDLAEAGLYGQWLWRDQGKMVVVTEGEIDALTVSQLQDNKWPVVSVPSGSTGARKALSAQLQWLLGFEKIVLFFDDDKPGQDAVADCAPLFPPGRVYVAKVPGFKDANEAYMKGSAKAVIDAIWGAKEYRPDGIVSVRDIRDLALTPPKVGSPWPWDTLTRWTMGRRDGEVYTIGAGTGIGKSEVIDQLVAHILKAEDKPVGLFKFEQPVGESVQRIAGKMVGRLFHLPDQGVDPKELVAAVDYLDKQDKLFLYNHFGQCDWEVVATHIRYLVASRGVKDFVIDHLTALAETGDDERGSLETIMKEIATLAQELQIKVYLISHLTTPDGVPHEEGGRVMIRHFKGSRAIGFWSHFMFGLERNQQHEDERWRSITTFRFLKGRFIARHVGETFFVGYDFNTGMLNETEPPPDDDDFKDETKSKRGKPAKKGKSSDTDDGEPF